MKHLEKLPKYGVDLDAWWINTDIEHLLEQEEFLVQDSDSSKLGEDQAHESSENNSKGLLKTVFFSLKYLSAYVLILLGVGLFWWARRRERNKK